MHLQPPDPDLPNQERNIEPDALSLQFHPLYKYPLREYSDYANNGLPPPIDFPAIQDHKFLHIHVVRLYLR